MNESRNMPPLQAAGVLIAAILLVGLGLMALAWVLGVATETLVGLFRSGWEWAS